MAVYSINISIKIFKRKQLDIENKKHNFLEGNVLNMHVGLSISSDNGLISQKLLLKSKLYYPLHVAMGVDDCKILYNVVHKV